MKPVISHRWDLPKEEALILQNKLACKVIRKDKIGKISLIAGADVAYQEGTDRLIAAIVVLDVNSLDIIEVTTAESYAIFPYIPGFFSFREIPPLVEAFSKLCNIFDIVVCDGQGIAHPRRFGLACHLGVLFDLPTIGCSKTRLIGNHEEPTSARGSFSSLIDNNEVVGRVLRTQNGVKPVYVSIGHRISLETACEYILQLSPKYRLPETTRRADQIVRKKIKLISSKLRAD
jgi:deoxyribonuclease V